jgi:hypothetical protein
MKNVIYLALIFFFFCSCKSSNIIAKKDDNVKAIKERDTVRIANDELEYEVIIIDPGFSSWLAKNARPRGFYSINFLENRNQTYVVEWNSRFNQIQGNNRNIYEMRIDYQPFTHYGYEVNYLLYNYFIYFQITNNQKLGGFIPSP